MAYSLGLSRVPPLPRGLLHSPARVQELAVELRVLCT